MRSLVIVGCCFIQLNAVAATRTWDGGAGTTSWHQAANWNPDGVPMTGDDVIIDLPVATTVVHSTGISNLNSLWTNQTLSITNQSSVLVQNASTLQNLILQGTWG